MNNAKKFLITVLCITPMLAFATAFQNDNLSPVLEGRAMAGSASDVGDLSAIFYNPALMSTMSGYQIYVGGAYSFAGINMTNASAAHGFTSGSNYSPQIYHQTVTGSTSQNNVVGSNLEPSIYFVMPIYEHLTYGMALTSPWDFNANYDSNSVIRDIAQKTIIQAYNISALFSYELNNQFSFGVGLQAQSMYAAFSNFDAKTLATPSTLPTQASNYQGTNWGFGYILGALYSPDNDTHIGVSYRSQIDYNLTGSGTQYLLNGSAVSSAICNSVSQGGNNCDTSVGITMNTPAVFNISLSRALAPQWMAHFTFATTFWSSLKTIDFSLPDAYINNIKLNTNFQNSEQYLMGIDYLLNSHLTLRAGTGYETSPFTANMQYLGIPLNNDVPLSAGLSYHINNRLNIDLAYIHRFYLENTMNSSQAYGSTHPYVPYINSFSPVEFNSASANYAGGIDTVGLGISYKF